jgi:pimeloyl-ACP methyl ester carboxylesterase
MLLDTSLSTSSLLVMVALGLILFLVIGYGLWRWREFIVAREARLQAQIAKDSHELDLDTRLGELRYCTIRDRNDSTDLEISYRQCGHGSDLLLLHGIGASKMIYRRMTPLLSGEFRVTCIDFPGFGQSSKPRSLSYDLDEQAEHLKKIVEALELHAPLAVASSMGGAICLTTALKNPELFRGVIAISPATDPKRIPMSLLPLAKHGETVHKLNSDKIRAAIVRAVVGQVIARRELITPGLLSLYYEPFRHSELASAAFLKAFRLLADQRMPSMFREIKTPLLIIRGLRDRLVKQSACEDLHRIVSHSELITHPTGGHHLMEDEPEFVAEEVRKFAARVH